MCGTVFFKILTYQDVTDYNPLTAGVLNLTTHVYMAYTIMGDHSITHVYTAYTIMYDGEHSITHVYTAYTIMDDGEHSICQTSDTNMRNHFPFR